ncbi:uncharacterized protein LOC106653867 [Trichogramma pretiosum]|uniref:uncharacterized protein LOC106653867 n=1 Tax=Trichogramma pretiosum TaxID=7493 RepID=UPI0006C95F25|nr:uncharacterized protein LOC106653867 [Trichogramma pretiosum]
MKRNIKSENDKPKKLCVNRNEETRSSEDSTGLTPANVSGLLNDEAESTLINQNNQVGAQSVDLLEPAAIAGPSRQSSSESTAQNSSKIEESSNNELLHLPIEESDIFISQFVEEFQNKKGSYEYFMKALAEYRENIIGYIELRRRMFCVFRNYPKWTEKINEFFPNYLKLPINNCNRETESSDTDDEHV